MWRGSNEASRWVLLLERHHAQFYRGDWKAAQDHERVLRGVPEEHPESVRDVSLPRQRERENSTRERSKTCSGNHSNSMESSAFEDVQLSELFLFGG